MLLICSFCSELRSLVGFPGGIVVKNLPANAGGTRNTGSITGLGRAPEVANGNPLQYSCLGNPLHRGSWRATVHGVTESRTRLKQLSMHACTWPGIQNCKIGLFTF